MTHKQDKIQSYKEALTKAEDLKTLWDSENVKTPSNGIIMIKCVKLQQNIDTLNALIGN